MRFQSSPSCRCTYPKSTASCPDAVAMLLEACTHKLNLNMAARRVFLADGSEAFKPEDIPHEANVYISTGEPFLDPFKKLKDHLLLTKKVTWTMHGLMLPTDVKRQKTKPALSRRMKTLAQKTAVRILVFKNGMGQDGHEITVGKETMRKVSMLIDELQTAIKSNKGHLAKLGPQLQTEQEQFSSYVCQHIKSLPANTMVPGGLHLKVFENGKDTGEISVYISRKDLKCDSPAQGDETMQRLLLRIHQQLQGSSIKSQGLRLSSARIFDEHGQEIKSPLQLKNGQKIGLSYGKAYRSPLSPVLALTFDRVAAFARDGTMAVYKTFMDDAALLFGCDE
ncbi:Doublecortin domain-containing protein 1 [Cricetulus griseus]|uniref:Doublecortin domain-containing protein 1 n=1 Tax=Cricetulus griseus TaxID=10029 RepID=G3GZA4_CRIGR|nr:Doublecortin domain-containing protein 1 [Cricetulus griseus]